jgi:DNA-binding phage protein
MKSERTAGNRARKIMRRFDAMALYHALDARRAARDLTWTQVAAETGVSTTTLRRTQQGGRLEVDGVLAMVGWLDQPVEAFVRVVE